jgi:DNA-binding NtrC family response regulator
VITTTSAAEALAVLADTDVAVLVSDFEMPEMTGVELLARARVIRPQTVRILMTGRGTFDVAVAGINEGEIFRFISKPAAPRQLRQDVLAACAVYAQHVETAAFSDLVARRARLLDELEHEHPGITARPLDEAGRYRVDPAARDRVAGFGLDTIVALLTRPG